MMIVRQKHHDTLNMSNQNLLWNMVFFVDISGMEGEVGLVAGRSQREKRRSYKDLLREEEEIAAQVLKTSKKHHKVTAGSYGNIQHQVGSDQQVVDKNPLIVYIYIS